MSKRKLKRQLSLGQVVMLGTAGAIGAEIFVLTGHAAGISGPAFILALIIAGLLSYSIALNYGELASTFPVTGGALTYVREAWGDNLLTYLVGSLDCLSSTFYAGLSAVGFAYSLQVIIPSIPIVPTALAIIIVFVILNILGVGNVGNAQVVLGGILLSVLVAYILLGLILPGGFTWQTLVPRGQFFIYPDAWSNIASLFTTIALAYVAFIGFEVIADDAEEIKNPDRNLPLGILISLTLCLILYPLIAFVTLGTVPWDELAGSDVALTTAIAQFLPGIGPLVLAFAGIVATLTTLNAAMLSATREAFTMSRNRMWPRFLSRLSRFRTPHIATLVIGAIICAVAAIGLVDFLSYISSSGYLFVLFWSNLALYRLRQRYPDLRRPFKTPLFPIPVYLAMGTCFFIVAFTDRRALIFGVGLLLVLSIAYYLTPLVNRFLLTRQKTHRNAKDRILIAFANPKTGGQLVHLASLLAQASENSSLCVFHVKAPTGSSAPPLPKTNGQRLPIPSKILPAALIRELQYRNVPLKTKIYQSGDISKGILEEIETFKDIKLILAGWPGPLDARAKVENPVKVLLEKAPTNVLVYLDHNLGRIRNILVPIGGGPHSRLALRVAYELAEQEAARITALHIFSRNTPSEEIEDKMDFLREVIEDELGYFPARVIARIMLAESVIKGVLEETHSQNYDLLVMGASEEWGSGTRLFGSVDDWIIAHVENCSVLLARQYEPVGIHWLRRSLKRFDKENHAAD